MIWNYPDHVVECGDGYDSAHRGYAIRPRLVLVWPDGRIDSEVFGYPFNSRLDMEGIIRPYG